MSDTTFLPPYSLPHLQLQLQAHNYPSFPGSYDDGLPGDLRLHQEIAHLLVSRKPKSLHVQQRHFAAVSPRRRGPSVAVRYGECRGLVGAVVGDLGSVRERDPIERRREGAMNRRRTPAERKRWLGAVEERVRRTGRVSVPCQASRERGALGESGAEVNSEREVKRRMSGRQEPFQERRASRERENAREGTVEYGAAAGEREGLLHPGVPPPPKGSLSQRETGKDSQRQSQSELQRRPQRRARAEVGREGGNSSGTREVRNVPSRSSVIGKQSMATITTAGTDTLFNRRGYRWLGKWYFKCVMMARKRSEETLQNGSPKRKADDGEERKSASTKQRGERKRESEERKSASTERRRRDARECRSNSNSARGSHSSERRSSVTKDGRARKTNGGLASEPRSLEHSNSESSKSKSTTSGIPAEISAGAFGQATKKSTLKDIPDERKWWEAFKSSKPISKIVSQSKAKDVEGEKGEVEKKVYHHVGCAPGPCNRTTALDNPLIPEGSFCSSCMPRFQAQPQSTERRPSVKFDPSPSPKDSVTTSSPASSEKEGRNPPTSRSNSRSKADSRSDTQLPKSHLSTNSVVSSSTSRTTPTFHKTYNAYAHSRSGSAIPPTPGYGTVEPISPQLQMHAYTYNLHSSPNPNTNSNPQTETKEDDSAGTHSLPSLSPSQQSSQQSSGLNVDSITTRTTPGSSLGREVDEQAIWIQCSERLDHVSQAAGVQAWAEIRRAKGEGAPVVLRSASELGSIGSLPKKGVDMQRMGFGERKMATPPFKERVSAWAERVSEYVQPFSGATASSPSLSSLISTPTPENESETEIYGVATARAVEIKRVRVVDVDCKTVASPRGLSKATKLTPSAVANRVVSAKTVAAIRRLDGVIGELNRAVMRAQRPLLTPLNTPWEASWHSNRPLSPWQLQRSDTLGKYSEAESVPYSLSEAPGAGMVAVPPLPEALQLRALAWTSEQAGQSLADNVSLPKRVPATRSIVSSTHAVLGRKEMSRRKPSTGYGKAVKKLVRGVQRVSVAKVSKRVSLITQKVSESELELYHPKPTKNPSVSSILAILGTKATITRHANALSLSSDSDSGPESKAWKKSKLYSKGTETPKRVHSGVEKRTKVVVVEEERAKSSEGLVEVDRMDSAIRMGEEGKGSGDVN